MLYVRRTILLLFGLFALLSGFCALLFFRNTNPELEPMLKELARLRKPHLDRFILCIDGVAWSYMRHLQSQGYFSIFRPASKVVVTYPAMTNVSLSDIWHAAAPPGYESLYFDRTANAYDGGVTTYVGNRKPEGRDYHTLLDYEEPRQYEFLVYVSPLRIIAADLRLSILKLTESDKGELRHYIKSSDGLIHIRGRQGAEKFIRSLDSFLTGLHQANGGRTEIILFSDHGNEFIPSSQRVPIDKALQQAGYAVGSTLEGPRSVVIPAFGLVSFAAIYSRQEDRADIAKILSRQSGVDFVVFRQGDTILVEAASGQAVLRSRNGGASLSYEPRGADPLQLQKVVQELRQAGKVDSEGYAASEDWFTNTVNSEYPDALYRIWKGLTGQVAFPADLLVSFKAGCYYGNRTFDRFFDIKAMHGSLRPDSSEAFLMSTHRDYPAALRGEDIIRYLGIPVALESHYYLHPSGACDHLP